MILSRNDRSFSKNAPVMCCNKVETPSLKSAPQFINNHPLLKLSISFFNYFGKSDHMTAVFEMN